MSIKERIKFLYKCALKIFRRVLRTGVERQKSSGDSTRRTLVTQSCEECDPVIIDFQDTGTGMIRNGQGIPVDRYLPLKRTKNSEIQRRPTMSVFNKQKLKKIKNNEGKINKYTIMIVDDQEDNLKSIASLLVDEYNVIKARDGQDALAYLQAMEHPENLSLIISDQRMPNLTGIELFEQLISGSLKHKFPNTVRILITGFIDVPVILEAINEVKIYEFILKPFEPEDFLLRVKRGVEAFDRQQALDECCRNHHAVKERVQELELKNKELENKLEELLTKGKSVSLSSDDLIDKKS